MSLSTTAWLWSTIVLTALPAAAPGSGVLELGAQRYLLFDDDWLEAGHSVTFLQHSPQKMGVVLEADYDPQYDRPGTDFYNNGVIKYPWAHHAYFMRPSAFEHRSDTLEVHLATSRDGIAWRRPGKDRPWIGLGPAGSFDSHQLYIASGIVRVGDELWVYYTGFQAGHAKVLVKESHRVGKVGRAVLRLDGFVSARGGSQPGTLTTRPLRVSGRRLILNCDAGTTGAVRAELRDEANRPIPGFTLDECTPLSGDQVHGVVSWKQGSDMSALSAKPLRLHLVIHNADVYAFEFRK